MSFERKPCAAELVVAAALNHDLDKVAVIKPSSERVTYKGFLKSISNFEKALCSLVNKPVEYTLGILLSDHHDFFVVWFAAVRAGFNIAVLDPVLTIPELEEQLCIGNSTKRLSVLVTSTEYFVKGLRAIMVDQIGTAKNIVVMPSHDQDGAERLVSKFSHKSAHNVQLHSFKTLVETFILESNHTKNDFTPNGVVHTVGTGGTCSRFSNIQLFRILEMFMQQDLILQLFQGEDKVLGATPAAHLNTLLVFSLTLIRGGTYVSSQNSCHGDSTIEEVLHAHSVTIFPGYSYQINRLIDTKLKPSNLRTIWCLPHNPLDVRIAQLVCQNLRSRGILVYQSYGFLPLAPISHMIRLQTETLPPLHTIEDLGKLRRVNKSNDYEPFVEIGCPLSPMVCKVVPLPKNYGTNGTELLEPFSKRESRDVGLKRLGEICIRTCESEHFFGTGEVGFRDATGSYWIVPAFSTPRTIRIDGNVVSTKQIELALLKVKGVEAVYVFGAPRPHGFPMEQVVKAAVVWDQTTNVSNRREHILAELQSSLSRFKLPNSCFQGEHGILFVKSIPLIREGVVDHWYIHQNFHGSRSLTSISREMGLLSDHDVMPVSTGSRRRHEVKGLNDRELILLRKENTDLNLEVVALVEKVSSAERRCLISKQELRSLSNSSRIILEEKRNETSSLRKQLQESKRAFQQLQSKFKLLLKAHKAGEHVQSNLSERVKYLKMEVEKYTEKCVRYESSLNRQKMALIDAEAESYLTDHRSEEYGSLSESRHVKKADTGIQASDNDAAEHRKENLIGLLKAARQEVACLREKQKSFDQKRQNSLSSPKNAQEEILKLREKCQNLEVENAVAIDFLLKLDTRKEANLMNDFETSEQFPFIEKGSGSNGEAKDNGGDITTLRISRQGSMEIQFNHSDEPLKSSWSAINSPVIQKDIIFDRFLIRERMFDLANTFNENDMDFPLEEVQEEEIDVPGLLCTLFIPNVNSIGSKVQVALEQHRLVTKRFKVAENFTDLIQVLLM